MNRDRVIGNFLFGFSSAFTVATAMANPHAFWLALGNGILQGMLSVGIELKSEGSSRKKKYTPTPAVTLNKIPMAVLL